MWMCSAEISKVIGIGATSLCCCASSSVSTLARGIRRGWLLWDIQWRTIRYECYWRSWGHGVAGQRD